ncbi:MAG: hypothetical protein CVT49_04990 [candidate division Zixibacteria bacterium HGW-Zixibacteria-1]|nr:MAG: hypothetical protein CVT49_04990 [candidate division Zixibacteria bacterium HGW-Zixibacteria-1]
MNAQYTYDYDKRADVLYAFIDNFRGEGITEEPFEGVLIRRDKKNYTNIIGFTILYYKRQKRDGYLKDIPFFDLTKIPF